LESIGIGIGYTLPIKTKSVQKDPKQYKTMSKKVLLI